jgi:AcrR family transcriptional regulator
MSFPKSAFVEINEGPLGSASAMVDTPWGRSETLRERRLRPGPGTPPEDVARNQRGRLFGAMVASVAERGYAATRLSDLAELSGVARKSFYALFADKQECFVAAMETMVDAVIRNATRPSGSWEEQVRGSASVFAELIVAQPAAARMCLIEAYVVGPAGVRPVEEAAARFEAHALAAALESGMEAEALPGLISAHVGGLLEIAQNRLRRDREAELPGLMNDFADLALSYQPPPEPLRLTTRRPSTPPAVEAIDAYGHMERVLQAFAAVAAERGYANTTIELVLKRASMSPTTFYANFASKEDILMAAIDGAGARLMAAILPAFRRHRHWAHGVRAAFGAFFNFLASHPALARLVMFEVYAAGPAALERREEALRPLEALLAEGRTYAPEVPRIATETLGGGTYALTYRQIRDSGPESLPGLAPICTYLTLAPFIGAEEACAAANGDGRSRGSDADRDSRLLLSRVGLVLNQREASAEMISREIGVPVEQVREQIGNLEQAGLILAFEKEADGDDDSTEIFYRSNTDYVDEGRWALMSLAERQAASEQIANLVAAEIDQAIELGTFDARPDRHLSRMPFLLDERGWDDLMAIHNRAFHASIQVQAESAERLRGSGKRGIPGSSMQAMFEVPKP